jgi:hypothetical protein
MLLFEQCALMFIYVTAVYVSSNPGTYIVRIRFTCQNRVWQLRQDSRNDKVEKTIKGQIGKVPTEGLK